MIRLIFLVLVTFYISPFANGMELLDYIKECPQLNQISEISSYYKDRFKSEKAMELSNLFPSIRSSWASNDNSLSKSKIRYGVALNSVDLLNLASQPRLNRLREKYYHHIKKEKKYESLVGLLELVFERDYRYQWGQYIGPSVKKSIAPKIKIIKNPRSRRQIEDQMLFLDFRKESLVNQNRLEQIDQILAACKNDIKAVNLEKLPKIKFDSFKKLINRSLEIGDDSLRACKAKEKINQIQLKNNSRFIAPQFFGMFNKVIAKDAQVENYNEGVVGINLKINPWALSVKSETKFDECSTVARYRQLQQINTLNEALGELENLDYLSKSLAKLDSMRSLVLKKSRSGAVSTQDFSNYLFQAQKTLERQFRARLAVYGFYYFERL